MLSNKSELHPDQLADTSWMRKPHETHWNRLKGPQ